MEQDKNTFFYNLKHQWICSTGSITFSLFLMHTQTHSHTLVHNTAARWFRVQSLTLLAKGMSSHNCKWVVCPRLWLQHHPQPLLNTSLSLVIAAIVIHATRKKQLLKNLRDLLVWNRRTLLCKYLTDLLDCVPNFSLVGNIFWHTWHKIWMWRIIAT